jgi:hypothetical protein
MLLAATEEGSAPTPTKPNAYAVYSLATWEPGAPNRVAVIADLQSLVRFLLQRRAGEALLVVQRHGGLQDPSSSGGRLLRPPAEPVAALHHLEERIVPRI